MPLAVLRQRLRPLLRPLLIQWRWRLLGRRVNRDQWQDDATRQRHQELTTLDWNELAARYPEYHARLNATLPHASGRVLELGCGAGNMTRWLSARPEVAQIVAVDAFASAVAALKARALPKVDAREQAVDKLSFARGEQFDTVVMCELLEHIYPDEERAMRDAFRPHLAPGARWVVSVPIGWLEDPHHVRAFSRAGLARHLKRHYGEPEGFDTSSGYSQVAWGKFQRAGGRP
jgi:2-polyprenyl-3-methyl-5-hydroxy-6-metoxy-1,4-benzoquinol methylase